MAYSQNRTFHGGLKYCGFYFHQCHDTELFSNLTAMAPSNDKCLAHFQLAADMLLQEHECISESFQKLSSSEKAFRSYKVALKMSNHPNILRYGARTYVRD